MLTLFTESVGVQQAIRAVEEPQILQAIVAELPDQAIGQVRVIIGGEGRWQDVQHLGMVVSRYGVPAQTTGACWCWVRRGCATGAPWRPCAT